MRRIQGGFVCRALDHLVRFVALLVFILFSCIVRGQYLPSKPALIPNGAFVCIF